MVGGGHTQHPPLPSEGSPPGTSSPPSSHCCPPSPEGGLNKATARGRARSPGCGELGAHPSSPRPPARQGLGALMLGGHGVPPLCRRAPQEGPGAAGSPAGPGVGWQPRTCPRWGCTPSRQPKPARCGAWSATAADGTGPDAPRGEGGEHPPHDPSLSMSPSPSPSIFPPLSSCTDACSPFLNSHPQSRLHPVPIPILILSASSSPSPSPIPSLSLPTTPI